MDLPELSELYNQFKIPDFEKWKNKVAKGLKTNASKPFASNFKGGNVPIAKTNTETGTLLVVDSDSNAANKEILFLLSQGIQAFEISFVNKTSAEHLQTLLKDVVIDYIHIFWNVKGQGKTVIEAYWDNHSINPDRHTFISSEHYLMVNNIQELAQSLDSREKNDKCLYIEVPICCKYIDEVSKLKAIHSFLNSKSLSNYKLIAKYNPDVDLDKDTRKIANTIMAMTAMVGSCSYVFPFDRHEHVNEVRLASNAIQILKFESKLELYGDPLAGSYMIEELTNAHLSTINEAI